jgi:pimeloyl-ACP methyl ester carboxylesterase
MNVRFIAVDRPGFGLSDFKEKRALVEWPDDVGELADTLELARFAVMGASGGGPYAAVCAARIPGRLSAAGLVCAVAPPDLPGATAGMVPLNRWLLRAAQTSPWLTRHVVGFGMAAFWVRRRKFIPRHIESRLPASDKRWLADRDLYQSLVAGSQEAFRRGVRGATWDGCLLARSWGFRLEDIQMPVDLWYGESDVIVPPAMGRLYARILPACRATFLPGEGHFSTLFGHVREILGRLKR